MKRNKGFTLVELLVASLVGAVVLTGVFASYQYIQRQYAKIAAQSVLQSTGRVVSSFVRRDLSMAGYAHRGSAGSYVYGAITETPLTISADKKGFAVVYDYEDPNSGVQRQRVSYQLVSFTNNKGTRFRLMRQVDILAPVAIAGGSTILADYVEDFFIYQGERDVTSGLMACYGFNGNLTDAVTSQSATISGVAAYVTGVADRALYLNGVSSASVAQVANLSFGGSFSLSFFIKPDDVAIADRVAVISKGANDYAVFLSQDRKVYVAQAAADGSAVPVLSSGAALTAGAYNHVAMVRDGTNLRVYVNAVPWELPFDVNAAVSTGALLIGKDGTGVYPNFQGTLDDMRFYARALSAGEVQTLASNAYQDCTAAGASLVNVAFVMRSSNEVDRVQSFANSSYVPGSADYVPATDRFLREAFTLAIQPKNL